MILYPKRFAIFDTETTGLDTELDEIVELGVKTVEKDGTVVKKSWILKGDRHSAPKALAAHGIVETERQFNGVDPKEALYEFIEIVGSMPLIGHNIFRYDVPLLAANMRRAGYDPTELWAKKFNASIDTAALYKSRLIKEPQRWYENHRAYAERVLEIVAPGVKYNLTHACKAEGIDVSDLVAHRTDGDVEMVHRLYNKLVQ